MNKDYITRDQRVCNDDSWCINTITAIGLYVLIALCVYIIVGDI